VQSVANRSLNMFTLIGLGVSVAYLYSLVALMAPGLFPAAMRTAHGMVPGYFEAAAVIVTLILLGQVLELRARSRTGAAIKALLGLAPTTARKLLDGGRKRTSPSNTCRSGTGSGYGPARRCPSTAWCSRGPAASTSP